MSVTQRKSKGSPDSVDVYVGKRLRVSRSLRGMSQEKLAEAIGLTFQQIQKYERGTNRVSAGRLYKFSQILDVPINYFYEHYEDRQDMTGNEDLIDNKETLDLLRCYYSVKDPNTRKDILKFVKSMAERTK